MGNNGTEQLLDPAAGAAILDRLLQIEDHVNTIERRLDDHAAQTADYHKQLLDILKTMQNIQQYYGEGLIKAYKQLELLYHCIHEQLRTNDGLDLSIAVPPKPPPN